MFGRETVTLESGGGHGGDGTIKSFILVKCVAIMLHEVITALLKVNLNM